jgi:hypothetical protein
MGISHQKSDNSSTENKPKMSLLKKNKLIIINAVLHSNIKKVAQDKEKAIFSSFNTGISKGYLNVEKGIRIATNDVKTARLPISTGE